jgi:hypothetical protein
MMRASVLLAAAMLLPATSLGDDSAINALWNDSGTKGEIGFWIYPLYGQCPELRTKAKPLVFAPKVRGPEHSVAALRYCFQLPERPEMPLILCDSGIVRFSQEEKSGRYRGTYSFVMADGSKRDGSFYAQYCAKGGS